MPVAPKSPPSSATSPSSAKRPGAPKAKGAVRAKSGCYTCRIRRKKCDEQPNDQGFCSTCVRLRLECLGFGAKRPDWLRENRNVLQLRDKIKNFLASQGMIKGHSGSGARSSDQPPVLRLTITEAETPSYHSGSSSSPPPSRSQTLPDDYSRRGHPTSHTRGGWNIDQTYHTNGHYATNSEYHRSTSPQSMDGGYSHPLSSSSPHSLVPPFPQRTIHRFHPYRQRQQLIMQGPNWNPAKSSSFGNSYNWGAQDYADMLNPAPYDLLTQPFTVDPLSYGNFTPTFDAGATPYFTSHPTSYHDVEFFLRCYVTDVVNKQYLLSTNSSRSLITSTISNRSSHEQQAATLLSRVHSLRFGRPPTEPVLSDPGVSLELHGIEEALASCSSSLTSEHAMAALHLVSAILFDGGHGRWSQYLHTAALFVRSRMPGLAWNSNGLEELRTLRDKDAFIVKTAIWFDVLASVTTNKTPLLLDIVRLLFRPDRSGVQELYNNNNNHSSEFNNNAIEHPEMYAFPENTMSEKEKTSMLSPMGCENIVVWALAEISALATWKKAQSELGRLSIEDLVMRGQKIKDALDTRYRGPAMIEEDFPDDVAYSRYLTAHIFRASAKLYLAAVVSGGYPHVPQVKSAVDEVMGWISRIPKKPTREDHVRIHKSVIRSTIFSFYITGALTDKEKHRKLLREYLLDEGSVVGNSQITEQLLVDIWAERTKDRAKTEVLWRERLLNNQDPILLV